MDAIAELEDVVRTLAAIPDRASATPGEREAAYWLADRFGEHGCEVAVEEETAHGTYWWPMGAAAAAGAVAGLAGLAATHRGRAAKPRGIRRVLRWVGIAGGAAAAASLIDDVTSGPRVLRNSLLPRAGLAPKVCWNVVARTGDPEAEETIVLMAHHDAPHTGHIFDQSAQKWFAAHFPAVLERVNTAPPLYWPVIAGPSLVAIGSLLRRRRLIGAGAVAAAVSAAVFADVGRSPVTQGANDDLSGVAGLVWVARALSERPVKGVRVIIASCGSEESFQEGITGLLHRHRHELPLGTTRFINLETVGSPRLLLLEGEGPVTMRDYDASFKRLAQEVAEVEGIPLTRGMRARTTTDSLITAREGYPTATFTSINEFKALSNYHLMSDIPDNLDWGTVSDAAKLAEAIIRRVAQ